MACTCGKARDSEKNVQFMCSNAVNTSTNIFKLKVAMIGESSIILGCTTSNFIVGISGGYCALQTNEDSCVATYEILEESQSAIVCGWCHYSSSCIDAKCELVNLCCIAAWEESQCSTIPSAADTFACSDTPYTVISGTIMIPPYFLIIPAILLCCCLACVVIGVVAFVIVKRKKQVYAEIN
jgi:hypothetical protein